jgi:AcrR family transcriptional regulator
VQQHAEIPPHIVDAASRVLSQEGLAAATLERISAAAGVSRMTLHRRGVSKEDIIGALAQRFADEHRDAIWSALVAGGSASDRLRIALEAQCRVSERNLATLEALSQPSRSALFHAPGPAGLTREVFVAPLQRLLADGAADGTLTPLADPAHTATVLFNAVGHTYRHLRTGHGWSAVRAREGVLALVMDGLVARA